MVPYVLDNDNVKMATTLSVDEVTAILLDEHQNLLDDAGSLPPKALYKILYFVKQDLERKNIDAEIPYYWYMYGTKVKTTGTQININETSGGNRISCGINTNDVHADLFTLSQTRRVVSDRLQHYYRRKLPGLTDDMYREAPYDVQRVYRELDKQLGVSADDEQTTLLMDNNATAIRRNLIRIFEVFPTDEFPQQGDTLLIWYGLMRAELLEDDFDVEKLQRLAKTFWRYFCLELALRENNDISKEEIERDRKIDDIHAEQERVKTRLLEEERETAANFARSSDSAKQAAEAFIVPSLDLQIEV